jgi:general secretion pathway protein A
MYRAFFGLGEAPFRITPDPRFLHLDPTVEAALTAITDGIGERDGLLLLVGEVGTGKTTLVRRLLDTLPAAVRTVLVLHPTVGFEEILDHLLLELGLPVAGGTPEALLERLAEFLREHAREGGTVAVFFDEAQALRDSTLAALPRLLDLVAHDGRPGIQLVLVGQPELDARLAAPALEPVRARIGRSARLVPLSPDGVGAYVRARLTHARATDVELFTPDAIERLAARSNGVPRVINVLCESALMAAFADGQRRITGRLIEAAWADYAPLHEPRGTPMPPAPPGHPDAEPAEAPRHPTITGRRLVGAAIALGLLALIPVLATRPWRGGPERAPERVPTTLASPAVPTPPTTPPTPPAPEPAEESPPPHAAPPSALDAIALVDRFWQAYGARDGESLRALFAPEAAPTGPVLDVDPTGGGALVSPAETIEAKPAGDRVTVRVPFVLSTRDDRGRPVRRQGVASLQVAMREGAPRIVALSADSGPVPRR